LLVALCSAAAAGAATIAVSSPADAGPGSLRAAIERANATPAADRIELPADLAGTIELSELLPPIVAPLELAGPGAGRLALEGSGTAGLLDVELDEGGKVKISGLALRGGVAADGGAIVSFDTKLVLADVALSGNEATNAGGAISVTGGSLTLLDSRLEDNVASYPGGAVQLYEAALRIDGSTLAGNSAGSSGGGIYVSEPSGRLLVEGSKVSGNEAGGDGGGVAVDGSAYQPLRANDSDISGNEADGNGDDVFPPLDRAAGTGGAGAPDSIPPASAGSNGTTKGPSAAANPNSIISAPLEALETNTGSNALLLNGIALAPPDAPPAVKAVIDAANMISGTPYVWGGGHGSWYSAGYDCSGAVSFALHGGGFLSTPLASGALEAWGAPGPGRWITVYANAGHTYAVIAGLRWDTVGDARGSGPRWHLDGPYASGFVARHPPGY
jgi:predicted outer membrane repeat protein